jgi:hypothetical protein
MAKEEIKFESFLENVSLENMSFVQDMHAFMLEKGCGFKIEAAKSGYVFSYLMPKTKKVVLNYVFRKSGMLVRIYADNIAKYPQLLETLPETLIEAVEKAPICKRLADPTKCNARCPMGYTFDLRGKTYKNCRYNAFLLSVNGESQGPLRGFIEREMQERLSA